MTEFARAFRLGDVRGTYPDDIDENFAYLFARAFSQRFKLSGRVATGRDMRESSAALQEALNRGFRDSGVAVSNLGLCTTELGYFASTRSGIEAAVVVTASHNPADHNGLKCVLRHGEAVTFDSGLGDVLQLMQSPMPPFSQRAAETALQLLPDYLAYFQQCFPDLPESAEPIAINGLNGTAATLASDLAQQFALNVDWFRREPGPMPREGADPMKPHLAAEMKAFMGKDYALGVAWDGDCDRCVFFDNSGDLVPTYYIVGMMAEHFLRTSPGAAIVFDTKLMWNTLDMIAAGGGIAVPTETGHAFMKQAMKANRAIYGGELSSHHYFGEFFGCDSGMFAWLKLLELMAVNGRTLGELIAQRRQVVRCTPEISVAIRDIDAAFAAVIQSVESSALSRSQFDGYSAEMPGDWRFSLCRSKTESLVRINFEGRGEPDNLLEGGRGVLKSLEPFLNQAIDIDAVLRIQ